VELGRLGGAHFNLPAAEAPGPATGQKKEGDVMAAEIDVEKEVKELFGGAFLKILETLEKIFSAIFSEARVDRLIAALVDKRIDKLIDKI
jgi:ribosomal protein L12E/L44/L45/RPP1/RPP2